MLLEQRDLGAGADRFAADEDAHVGWPAGELVPVGAAAQQPGQLGDVGVGATGAGGVERRLPGGLGQRADRRAGAPVEVETDRVVHLPAGGALSVLRWATTGCEAPAPSRVTSSRRRCLAGIRAIASVSTSMWSAAVLLPALPGRGRTASASPVLSHQAVSG